MKIVCLVPAHNEAATVTATVQALIDQTCTVDRIIVVADNCIDETATIALSAGAEVLITQKNIHMKAGALGFALETILPDLADTDFIVCIDADSIVAPEFVERAIALLVKDTKLAGVSGTYHGKPGNKMLGWCQRNEMARWGFDNRQKRGKTVILPGAAAVIRVEALHAVYAARAAGKLPGKGYYALENITEDFELSLAFQKLGYKLRNLIDVDIHTATKPTLKSLRIQRLRWDAGINQALMQYGLTKFTFSVWIRRMLYTLMFPISIFCLSTLIYRIVAGYGYHTNWFWLLVASFMMLEKSITILRLRGWRNALAAFLIIFEMPYDLFLHITFMHALLRSIFKRKTAWR